MEEPVHDPYASIAKLYEAEHQQWLEDIEMYRALSARAGSPVLELGCGSGRVILPLAEDAYEAHGIDICEPLLRIAAEKAKRKGIPVLLTQKDMRAFSSPSKFRLVFCALDSLLHLPQYEDLLSMLTSAFNALVPGGFFALDVVNPTPDLLAQGDGLVRRQSSFIGPSGINVTHFVAWDIDPNIQTIKSHHFYDWISSNDQMNRRTASICLRYWTKDQIKEALNATGFTSPELYGSVQLDTFELDSERMIFVTTRPTA